MGREETRGNKGFVTHYGHSAIHIKKRYLKAKELEL